MRLLHFLTVLLFFVASVELEPAIKIGGTVHLNQLLLMALCAAGLLKMLADGRVLWNRMFTPIVLWAAVQVLLMPTAGNKLLGIELTVQMLIAVCVGVAWVQIYGRSPRYNSLMRWYLWSYVALAVFGLLQFLLPIAHLPAPYIRQWLITGKLARINGFNYEPSFYATYMLVGWVLLLELRSRGARVVSDPRWRIATIALTASLLLSTSKTAIVVMVIELLPRGVAIVVRHLKRSLRYLRVGRVVLPVTSRGTLLRACLALAAAVFAVGFLLSRLSSPAALLQGTGLGGTASHSVDSRKLDFEETWLAARQHPWVGGGLAAVPEQIAADRGTVLFNVSDAREAQGFPTFLAVYAASGFWLFIPFALFCWEATIGAMRQGNAVKQTENGKWLAAMGRATLVEFVALSVDSNMFRVHLWVHLGLLGLVAYRTTAMQRAMAFERVRTPPAAANVPAGSLPGALPGTLGDALPGTLPTAFPPATA